MDKRETVEEIIRIFDRLYPEASCSLEFRDPLQLLVSAQLAAQCTDARVNVVTKELYKKYKTAADFANADLNELEREIRPTGFYHNKAKNIINCCRMIAEKFGGIVPGNLEDLLKLPGVGRKTANLVLGDVFGIPGIVVDTHAKRLSNRMGLTNNSDPTKIEFDLMKVVPEKDWSRFCHQLVYHGRAVCGARKPGCGRCDIRELCEYGRNNKK